MVNFTSVVVDYAQLMPMPTLDVSFCLTQNSECMGTVPKAAAVPGRPPLVNVQVPAGSIGFLRQTAMDHITQDYYLLAPMLVDDASLATPTSAFTLVGNDTLAGFVQDLGVAVDPSLGILAVFIADCDGNRVPGARLRLTELDSRPELRSAAYWAVNGRLPVRNVATDTDGTAGFVNVPISSIEVEATIGDYAFGKTRFRVAPNRITAATIRPYYHFGK